MALTHSNAAFAMHATHETHAKHATPATEANSTPNGDHSVPCSMISYYLLTIFFETHPKVYKKVMKTFEKREDIAPLPDMLVFWCPLRPLYVPLFTIFACVAQVVVFYSVDYKRLSLPVPCPASEWYRLLSNVIVHVDDFHVWSNVLSTVVLATVLEPRSGGWRVFPIWYLSAVLGTVFQALITTRFVFILGSSGGVYALLAAFSLGV